MTINGLSKSVEIKKERNKSENREWRANKKVESKWVKMSE